MPILIKPAGSDSEAEPAEYKFVKIVKEKRIKLKPEPPPKPGDPKFTPICKPIEYNSNKERI